MKFKDLSKEEKLALCEAVIDGKRVDVKFSDEGVWNTKRPQELLFHNNFEYRITPEKPSINWDHVAPEYEYLASSRNGMVHIHTVRPMICDGVWISNGRAVNADVFASFKAGNCAPEESLVERPE